MKRLHITSFLLLALLGTGGCSRDKPPAASKPPAPSPPLPKQSHRFPTPELPPETRKTALDLLEKYGDLSLDDTRALEIRKRLVEMGHPISSWLLSRMLSSDRNQHPFRDEDIVEILQAMEAKHLVPTCLDLLSRVDASRRRLLADLLLKIGTSELSGPLTDIILRPNTDRSLRMTCAGLLIRFRNPETVQRLLKVASTPEHPAAPISTYILGQLQAPEALPVLLDILTLGHNPRFPPDALTDNCRAEAAQAISLIGISNRSIFDALESSVRSDPSISVRVRALEALETLDIEVARKRLDDLREVPQPAIREVLERIFAGS